jgi:hypothetical protein
MPTLDTDHVVTHLISDNVYIAPQLVEPLRVHVQDDEHQQIILQESIANLHFPAQMRIQQQELPKDLGAAGLIVLPIMGGGRGPVINNGETITSGLLLSLLTGAIGEEQLTPEFINKLSHIIAGVPNSKNQEGYGKHNDVITLDHDWSGYPPIISVELAPGEQTAIIQTQVGTEPDCYTFIDIPQQEILYGHTGIVDDNQFTLKAAILTKSDPTVMTLDWSPTSIIGPPITNLTTESSVITTTLDCMGLKVNGTITLVNSLAYDVDGTMFVQMSIDNGDWINIARLRWNFTDGATGVIIENFDSFIMRDQSSHTYKFRGQLLVESSTEVNRKLTGSIHIDTVTEIGAGSLLSNDPKLKWKSKE